MTRAGVVGLGNMGAGFAARLIETGYETYGYDVSQEAVDRPAGLQRGWFVEPTVFGDVDNKMQIARDEIFGPVASVLAYDDVDDAVQIANDSAYGLHGTVFSADDDRALAVARRVDSGTMGVNRFGFSSSTPFGGVKMSGIGREHGPEGFDSFLEYHAFGLPQPRKAA